MAGTPTRTSHANRAMFGIASRVAVALVAIALVALAAIAAIASPATTMLQASSSTANAAEAAEPAAAATGHPSKAPCDSMAARHALASFAFRS